MDTPPFALSLIALRAFETVGRLGGIRRAAQQLGVNHSIVSRHLKSIEEQVGTTLFDRDSGRLTAGGAVYHARISGAFAEIAAATAALDERRSSRLVISAAPGLALLWLTQRLTHFGAQRMAPVVELQARDFAADLINEAVDADIRYVLDEEHDRHTSHERGIRSLELARPPVFPVAAPALADALKSRLGKPSDLVGLPLIEEGDGTDWRLWLAAKQVPIAIESGVARYGHAHLALAAAKAGQGIALANPYLLGDDLAAGRLVRLAATDPDFAGVALGGYVLRASANSWSNPVLARFRRWLLGQFKS